MPSGFMLACVLHMQTEVNARSHAFYEDAAAAAGALNISIDIWAAAEEYCGLACMQALCHGSGGSLFLYPCSENAAMPQVGPAPHWQTSTGPSCSTHLLPSSASFIGLMKCCISCACNVSLSEAAKRPSPSLRCLAMYAQAMRTSVCIR